MSQKSEKKSKIYKKSFTLLYAILIRLMNHLYPSQIARQLNEKKQKVFYHIHRLEREGYIKKKFRDAIISYSLTTKGEKFLDELKIFLRSKKSALYVTKSNIRNHTLGVKLKILRDNIKADFSKELNYNVNPANKGILFVLPFPIGMTIEKYQEHVVIDFHKFYTEPKTFMNDFFMRMWKGVWYVSEYLKRKYDVIVDAYEPEIIRFHLANQRPDLDNKIKEKVQVTVGLGRKAKVIFPTEIDAKAWVDRSHGHAEIETNDLLYEEKLILMPETVDRLAQQMLAQQVNQTSIMSEFSKNIATHTKAIRKLAEREDKSNMATEKLASVVERLEKTFRRPVKRMLHKNVKRRTARRMPGMVDESKIIDSILRRLNG